MANGVARSKSQKVLGALLGPGYPGRGEVSQFTVQSGAERVPLVVSGTSEFREILFLSPGFASSLKDYGPLLKFFEQRYLVVRMVHLGSTRFSGLQALLRMAWARLILGQNSAEAAQFARAWIHRAANRERRVRQLSVVVEKLTTMYPGFALNLAGHSFGTDTVLRWSLRNECQHLYLFSPHAPGYLIPEQDYRRIRVKKTFLIVGSQDWTRDGVGPQERLSVASALPAQKLKQTLILDGVRHMDFAFSGWGPPNWEQELGALF